jgi:hypothetical protein
MKIGVRYSIAGLALLLALAGCGRGFLQYGERASWRHEAEVSCLKSGAVKIGSGVVQIQPIEGPGMCGADFPLKVSALGESSPAMSYGDDLRPPGAIPGASTSQMPRWPVDQPRYVPDVPPPPRPVQTQPIQGGNMRWMPGAQPVEAPQADAPTGQPMSISPPGVTSPDMAPRPAMRTVPVAPPEADESDDVPDDAVIPNGSAPRSAPRTQPAYNAPVYQQPPEQPRTPPRLGPVRGPNMAAAGPAELIPPATLACPLVSALDRWVSEGVQPAALHWFGVQVTEIKQISAYSCRGMVGSGTSTISEHAFGNALDIAGFTFADGRKITVKDGWRGTPEEQGFLHDVQFYACETFTTVLAPGYNIYHYNHIHVDLMRRASGRRPCRPNAIQGEVAAAKARAQYASKMRGPAYTGSISSKASLPEAPPGEDGYVADDDGDEGVTGSIPASQKPKSSGGFGDAIARLLGRSSPPAKKSAPEDRMTHSY